MKTLGYGSSDVGRRRSTNEDELRYDDDLGLYAVADGMGGHAAGEVASRLAIETLLEAVEREARSTPPRDADAAARVLREAVAEANRRICDTIREHENLRGMGTTVVAMLRAGDEAVIGHVGDSRVYLLRDGELLRLTSDHSWVNEQVRLGLLSDEAAQRHPMRNIVTRALGSRSEVAVDVAAEPLRPRDLFVLCSDGLNTMLSDDEIKDTLIRHARSPQAACDALIAAANDRGGEDNVTVIVVATD